MPDAPQWDGKIHGRAETGEGFVETPRMVLRDGRRLNAFADVQLKGDTKKSAIESKTKSRLSSDAFGKKFGTSSSRQGLP